jgi:hypothetical protein
MRFLPMTKDCMENTSRARRRALALLALPSLMLAGCASITGPREVEIPLERLQRGLEQRFPLQQRALGVFELQLARPRLAILRDNDRLALDADVSVTSPVLRRALQGTVALSGRLQVDNVRNAVVLSEARIERFGVGDTDERTQGQLAAAANIVVERLVRDVPVYHFRPEDLRRFGVQYMPTKIHTTPLGVSVTFEPASKP